MSIPVGLLRLATVFKVFPNDGIIEANLDFSSQTLNTNNKRTIQIPFAFYSSNGLFIGGYPQPGTQIIVGQGEGGKWYFVSFYSTAYYQSNSYNKPLLTTGELLIQASDSTKIKLNNSGNINIGSNINNIFVSTKDGLKIDTFNQSLSFTEASREITGPVKRDLNPNPNISDESKLTSYQFDEYIKYIGLDPKAGITFSTIGNSKNPPFVEKRELLYEFLYSSDVSDELFESSLYGKSSVEKKKYTFSNRRKSRTDTLSLTLAAPNFLMETVKGTVIDIFGNILDINRVPLPVGINEKTIKSDGNKNKSDIYLNIRELERRSIAYHFEINSRKDLKGKNGTISLPDINSNKDYSRNRSRFFVDIDKEGLIKVNVPASSETGNIPLLTRYENYSTFGEDDDKNPDKLFPLESNLDIFLDSFAYNGGSISIEDDKGIITPTDRITKNNIKHGTVYHDILNTLKSFQSYDNIQFNFDRYPFENANFLNINQMPILDPKKNPIVSPKIILGKNAGGRSGNINFDGSLELNVGANTVDRQSLWIDTAGSIIGNIGRDKNNISAGISMNGDLLIEVGGIGIGNDSRFSTANGYNNAYKAGAVDIRVYNDGGQCTVVRIDNQGVKIMTPGNMALQATGNLDIRGKTVNIAGEQVYIHDRLVNKFVPNSIG